MLCHETDRLLVQHEGSVLRIWLDRPDVLNALDGATVDALTRVYREVDRLPEVRVVVLGGRGRAFTGGADLHDHPSHPEPQDSLRRRRQVADRGRQLIDAVLACPAITIARTHSHTIGAGVLLAAASDFRIGAEDTVFRLPEVELGLPLSWGGTPLLIKELGAARAREMILTCRPFSAHEAHLVGLLNTVCSREELDDQIEQWVERFLRLPHHACEATKQQFQRYSAATRMADVTGTDADIYQAARAHIQLAVTKGS